MKIMCIYIYIYKLISKENFQIVGSRIYIFMGCIEKKKREIIWHNRCPIKVHYFKQIEKCGCKFIENYAFKKELGI